MPAIPFLPDNLIEVPTGRAAWADWRRAVIDYRAKVHDACAEGRGTPNARDPAQAAHRRAANLRFAAEDPAYFLAIFGWIHEPRAPRGHADQPFVPYPFQVDLLRQVESCMETPGNKGDLVISKSRDMGATWTMCAWVLHGWIFKTPWIAGLVSRKESLVDDPGNPDSMFEKIIFTLERLPAWMIPRGFTMKDHKLRLKLINPTNRNAILGESTTARSGRGGRATVRINDEAAFYDNLNGILTAQKASTNHIITLSSESIEHGPDFYNLRRSAELPDGPTLMEMDWHLHPEHDETWFAETKSRYQHDPQGFEREVLRNPHAGFGDWVYEKARELGVGDFPYQRNGDPLLVWIDPGWDDDTAMHWVQHDAATGRFRVIESYVNNHKPGGFYASVGLGLDDPLYHYDERDRELMAWTRTLPDAEWVGDPYGDNIHGAGSSFYGELREKSSELLQREHQSAVATRPIDVSTSYTKEDRSHKGRREALMVVLPFLDFNDTPEVRRTLAALQEHRFKSAREGRETVTEQVKPLHDWTSHRVTALEYGAVHRRLIWAALEFPRAARRTTTAGKRVA